MPSRSRPAPPPPRSPCREILWQCPSRPQSRASPADDHGPTARHICRSIFPRPRTCRSHAAPSARPSRRHCASHSISLVTGLPSAAMKRAVPGSDSIAVFGAMSIAAPLSQDQAFGLDHRAVEPQQSGAGLERRDHRFLSSSIRCLDAHPAIRCYDHRQIATGVPMSWQPSNDPVLGDPEILRRARTRHRAAHPRPRRRI